MKTKIDFKRRIRNVALVLLAVWGVYTGIMVWRLYSTWMHAKQLYESGKYAAAVPAFRQHQALDPDDAASYYWLGNALGFSNQLEAAVVELRRAVSLDARNSEYHAALGGALGRLKRHAEAVASYRKAVELKPNDAELHASLGVALYNQGSRADAAGEFRQALAIDPDCELAKRGMRKIQKKPGSEPHLPPPANVDSA